MAKNQDLPGVEGPGVGPVKITAIDRAIAKYERAKDARCNESPKEVAAKTELRELLHQNRAQLPINGDGLPFYRSDDRDYILQEVLKTAKVQQDGADED